ncbi:MAG: methionine--tRNA ligase [Candidatus Andersenbacteria bacterium]
MTENKFFITTPIYYVNARPHIGTTYTTIAADVMARWYRQQGRAVLFSTGVDENSQKNVEAAERAGQDIQTYVDDMAKTWEETFQKLGFSYDVFIRTTSPQHQRAVTHLLEAITAHGDIYLGDYVGFYCVDCETFIAAKDLVDGLCPIHHTRPQEIKEKNYFFRLRNYQQQLLDHYAAHPDFVQPVSARNKLLYYIEHEMEDISISRQAQAWGIRLPQDPSHAVYVWFDALINYLTVAGYPDDQEKFSQYWPADLHLIGKDIIKFHGAIWPAMLLAAALPLPRQIFAHGFFTVDGQKISKSRGLAIDPLQLAAEYPFDAIRYYLLRDIPFGNDGDFSYERLQERYNADLANGLGNLVSRTLNMIEKFWPDFDEQPELPTAIEQTIIGTEAYLEKLAFDMALTELWRAIAWADLLIETRKPWELAKVGKEDELKTTLRQLFAALQAITKSLEPFMPDTHQKLVSLLQARPLRKPATPLFARKQ